ncbi:hypothetical protein D031_1015A, partial [Vibrio parahaemolyticus VP-48]
MRIFTQSISRDVHQIEQFFGAIFGLFVAESLMM